MKPREIPHIHKIPKQFKRDFWRYTLKKGLGIPLSNAEKEANQILRVLAKADSSIEEVNGNEIKWNVAIANKTHTVFTRRFPSSDLAILYQVIGKAEYSPAIEILKKKLPKNTPIRVVDAGANIGLSSLYIFAHFPQSEILSLEIDSQNFERLKKHTMVNEASAIIPVLKALWKKNSFLEIKSDFRDQTECSFYVEESTNATDVEGHDLNHFLAERKWEFIDFLKIDIEGAERYLFESEEQADNLLSKTNVLAIEIHDEFQIREKIYNHFQRNGFSYFDHGDVTIAHRN